MDAIRRILLPTDFHGGGGPALWHATLLADQLEAELHLLHVEADEAEGVVISDLEAFGEQLWAEAAWPVKRPSGRGLAIRSAICPHSDPASAILGYANAHRIDLIALGAYEQNHGEHFSGEAVARKVMRLASCDVLTSGPRGFYGPETMRRILAPVDFSPRSRHALARARMLAKQAGALLTVLYVVETSVFPGERPGSVLVVTRKSHEAYQELARFYRETEGPEVPHRFMVVRGRPADQIAGFADRHRFHLIVQGARGRTGNVYANLGNVARAVLRLAPCPVLTVTSQAGAAKPTEVAARKHPARRRSVRAKKTKLKGVT